MSEVKTNEPVKQEGDFKLKKKTPRKLTETKQEVTKVNVNPKEPLVELEPEVKKVVIPKQQEENAVQAQETNDSNVIVEKPKDSGNSEAVVEEVRTAEEAIEIIEEASEIKQELKEAVRDEKVLGKQLPENIEKLVSFMEDTGGSVEDYVRLNADYTSVDDNTLLKEYYRKEKPYLDNSDIDLLLEDFQYDEDLDEDRDIRKKKLAFKEEVAKAKNFLEETKEKYYADIKLKSNVNPDAKKAMDFFNRYNKQQEATKQQHEEFKNNTKKLFTEDFEGFDINVGAICWACVASFGWPSGSLDSRAQSFKLRPAVN